MLLLGGARRLHRRVHSVSDLFHRGRALDFALGIVAQAPATSLAALFVSLGGLVFSAGGFPRASASSASAGARANAGIAGACCDADASEGNDRKEHDDSPDYLSLEVLEAKPSDATVRGRDWLEDFENTSGGNSTVVVERRFEFGMVKESTTVPCSRQSTRSLLQPHVRPKDADQVRPRTTFATATIAYSVRLQHGVHSEEHRYPVWVAHGPNRIDHLSDTFLLEPVSFAWTFRVPSV